ncbi:unnamed protein product [Adineta ricciae]|uniref:Uncharacterized protein n=1 Tax=Adineta ricciae TaxID=249248 RepID=A0A814JLE9_ADIRI|nr:unnamed protein product [Adineta ricciae]CAF1509019.1 unnamed protein product [Adineta ricciae]
MRVLIVFSVLCVFILAINGQFNQAQQMPSFQQSSSFSRMPNSMENGQSNQFIPQNINNNGFRIPYPQCLSTDIAGSLLTPSTLQSLFETKLQQEERKLANERVRNTGLNNNDIMDFDAAQLRVGTHNGALVARVATKVSQELVAILGCETNATITQYLDHFLKRIHLPGNTCVFAANPDCSNFINHRSITGVCNNLQRPYEGSAQTAYSRLLPAAYDDGLSKPRSQSVLGEPLPSCRQISLSMGSKPVFDTSYNNFFVAYGQFIMHDIILSLPVTDSGSTPISSCSCESQDSDMCTVVDVAPNDPFMAGQQCMATPATAQAFSDQVCSLGVKEQMNANSHYIDLSVTYGSTRLTAHGLRTGTNGFLKTAKRPWSKFDLPPGQREGKSCVDGTDSERCFAGGDSRLMENLILTGIQAQWVRAHNIFTVELAKARPDWKNDDFLLYEEAKRILVAVHQRITYDDWLPILIGKEAANRFTGDNGVTSRYDPSMPGVVFNEAAAAALRLHTLVRDLFTRCTPKGELIDQVWLRDVNAKCKLAYDAKNNGVDSLLCGSLFDYGFAGDTNYVQDIHHRLFESVNRQGEIRRNDIVAINICRAREHGIPGYNAFRELCGLPRASQFQDFTDTMSFENAAKLKMIYKHPEDVDLFIGINHENHVPGGLVGPVSACIIGTQFRHLKYGDRHFYKHEGQFTPAQLDAINRYSNQCFFCHTTDIEKVQANPFQPPNDQTNPLGLCSQCPIFDFKPWRVDSRTMS